jgi:hypothetical protein
LSELEIITLALSLILGLSMAQMLSSVALAFRARHECRPHWIPLTWAVSIFLFHVQFWFSVYDLDSIVPAWTWDWFGPILLLAVLLFLSGAVILPSRERDLAEGLLGDFESHGKYALVPISFYLAAFIPMNVRMGMPWVSAANGLDVVLVCLAGVAILTKRARLRTAATVLFPIVQVWGVLFVWSSPGS